MNSKSNNSKTNYWKKRLMLEDDETIREIEEAVLNRGIDLQEEQINDELVHITDIKEEIEEEYKNWDKVKGLSTGYPSLDDAIGGMGKGQVILIGGATSQGKSAFATNIAINVAKKKPVLFITLEMRRTEIGSRIMHINGDVDDLDIMFQSEHRLTYKDLKPLIKKSLEIGTAELVVLDYLQYLGRGMTEKEVAIMSKEIKTIALEFDIPLLVIVSLRKSEGGKNKRHWKDIEIEDYMGSGAIGYDCDSAFIVSRKDELDEYDEKGIHIKILKTRNSKLNKRFIRFNWNATKITEDW
jgi:replicative DNA helicase